MLRPRELSSTLTMFPARTPTLAPATHTNSYAIGGRDVVLVEPATPYDDERRAWLEWARGLASGGRNLAGIVVTHHHEDHVGGAAFLARELGIGLWAHDLTAALLDDEARELVTRRLADGDEIVLDGTRREVWKVLHTPGHAPGHVCLHETPSRALVVGDMIASVGTILVAPGDGDMKAYIEQLERLASLDAALALPAHGDPVDDPTALFHRYVSHRLMREEKVLDAVRAAGPEGATSVALVPTAYADTPAHLWPLAKLSLEAHLDKLEREGRVRVCAGAFVAVLG